MSTFTQLQLFQTVSEKSSGPNSINVETAIKNKKTIYLHIEGDIPIDIPEGAFVSVTRNPPLKIYSIGFQPAKSIPEIPRWFLHKYGAKPFNVLEPFAGSGTTIIEALRYGASVFWLDYQPLSRLICKVKTTHFSCGEIMQEASKILQDARNQKEAPETVQFVNKDFWFQKTVQEGLEILRKRILKSQDKLHPILLLAFASTVRKSSNMNDGMLLAARRAHIEKIPIRSRSDVFNTFQFYISKFAEAIFEWNALLDRLELNSIELSSHDARDIGSNFIYDAVITSPPYINAIDYVWAAKFELHWLGMIKTDEERLQLYSNEIGTERIPREECKDLGRTGHHDLDKLIELIYSGEKYKATSGQNHMRARVVYKYFMDMKKHFADVFSNLRQGGYYCFTIGDMSKICGVEIPVANFLNDLACEIGFRRKFHFHLLLKNRKLNVPRNVDWAGTIKHDTTIILEKPA
ncbi:MAG: DNA methylase [Candidatus Competibacteraceae bacterium]